MLPLDAGRSDTLPAFADALRALLGSTFGRPAFDFLVHDAGHALRAGVAETPEAQFDEIVAVHLKAPFSLTQRLLPMTADGGRVLNVSTGLARFTLPGAIATDFGGVVRDDADVNRRIAGTIPLGRVGRPDDVGAAVAALLCDAGGWIYGQRVEVSGGQNL